MPTIHVEIWGAAEENALRPTSKDLELFSHCSDFPCSSGNDRWGPHTLDESFVLPQSPLETFLHEDQILSVQGLGGGNKGWADRRQRLRNGEGFGRVCSESSLQVCDQAVKAGGVRVGTGNGCVDGRGISGSFERFDW